MKTTLSRHRFLTTKAGKKFTLSLLAVCAFLGTKAQAADLFWSGDATTEGGAGAWNTNTVNFSGTNSGPFDTIWTGPEGDNAIFEGTGGAVVCSSVPLKGTMFVKSPGYAFSGTLNVGTVGATNDAAIGVTNTISAVISGSGSLTKNGAGVMILAAANSYTGGTFLNAGTLGWSPNTTTIGANSAGVKIYINADNVVFANSGTAAKTPQQAVDQMGDLICDDSLITNPAVITFSGAQGPWTIKGADRKISVNGLASMSISSSLQDDGTARTLSKAGSGLLTLSLPAASNSPFSGPIIIKSGPLRVSTNPNALGSTSAGTTVEAGGVLQVNVSGIAEPVTLNGTGTNNDGALRSISTTPTFTGPITLGSSGVRINADASTLTLSGGITGVGDNLTIGGAGSTVISTNGFSIGTGSLTKDGAGTLTLAVANSFSGGTTISAGKVSLGNSTALGSGSVSFAGVQMILNTSSLNVANPLTINGGGVAAQGVLYYNQTNGSATYSGAVNIIGGASTGGLLATASGGELIMAGPLTSSAQVTIRNGIVTLGNASNSFSSMSIQGGTCKLGVANAIPTAATVDMAANGAATIELNGFNQTLAGLTKSPTANTANVINSGAGTPTLTVDTSTTNIYGGVLGGTGNSFNLTKAGNGILVLGGNSTYTGVTLVSGGTLKATNIAGSATSSGTVTVAAAGTLSGNGMVSGTVSVNGTIAPGDGVGTLSTGAQTWAGGGHYSFEINQASGTAGATNGWDLANITGGLTITATSGSKFIIDLSSVALTDFDSASNYSWSIAKTTTGISGFNASAFAVNTTGFTNSLGGGTFSVSANATDILLVFTAQQGAQTPATFTTSAAGQGSFYGSPSTTYTIQYADILTTPMNWQFLMSVTTDVNGLGSFADASAPNGQAKRFYRVNYP